VEKEAGLWVCVTLFCYYERKPAPPPSPTPQPLAQSPPVGRKSRKYFLSFWPILLERKDRGRESLEPSKIFIFEPRAGKREKYEFFGDCDQAGGGDLVKIVWPANNHGPKLKGTASKYIHKLYTEIS
jgi:hypothetical protein